jgi:hypothetical protein
MPVTRRYTPEHPPGESCTFGMDFSMVIPPGVGINTGSVDIWTNRPGNVVEASADWSIGSVIVRGRALYCTLSGGVLGMDYQIRWTATDTDGNVWPRIATVLCAYTS